MRHPVSFRVVAGAAWLFCAAQAVCGVGEGLVLCPFRLATGRNCPGCGMGRAVVAAMRGDFAASFHSHPLGIPMLIVWTVWLAYGFMLRSSGRRGIRPGRSVGPCLSSEIC